MTWKRDRDSAHWSMSEPHNLDVTSSNPAAPIRIENFHKVCKICLHTQNLKTAIRAALIKFQAYRE